MATPSLCKNDGCDRLARVRGYCSPHYHDARNNNTIQVIKPTGLPPLKRFMERTETRPGSDCIYWAGARTPGGYGLFWSGSKPEIATRWLWKHFNGEISGNLFVLHNCNQGKQGCVNIEHLRLGTAQENANDMVATRNYRGEGHWLTKLSDDDIRAIRIEYQHGNADVLSVKYGVSAKTISMVVRKRGRFKDIA